MNRGSSNWRVALIFGLGFLLGRINGCWVVDRVTTTRVSPDETLRVRLVEAGVDWYIDRNFVVRLDRLETGGTETIFRSPDESPVHKGTERFIWSKDGTKVLLVGRHFDVHDDLFLDNGDQAYFLHDVKAGQSWINSEMIRSSPLTADLIAGIEFTEPVILKPRAKVDPDSPKKPE